MVQILDEASMGYLVDELDNHIEKKVIPTILQYQGGSEPEVATLNGEEASDHESVSNEAETIILHVIDKLKDQRFVLQLLTIIATVMQFSCRLICV